MLSTPAPPRSGRAEATRRHLLEVAATAIAEHGYAATSMTDLVKRSGLTRGAFYFHFASKEELALAAFRMKQQEFIERLTQRLRSSSAGSSALEQLLAGLRIRAEMMQREPSFACLRRLCTELRTDPRLAAEVSTFHTAPVALTTSVLEQAQRDGDVRDDIPAARLAWLLFAANVGIDEVGQGSERSAAATEDLITVLLHGLGTRPDHAVTL